MPATTTLSADKRRQFTICNNGRTVLVSYPKSGQLISSETFATPELAEAYVALRAAL